MIALREAHPVLRRTRFLHGNERSPAGVKDITWFSPSGREKTAEQWQDRNARCLGMMLNGRAGSYRAPDGRPANDGVLLIILNAYHDVVPFTLPPITGGAGWRRLLDTTDPELRDDRILHEAGQPFSAPGRSLVLFICQPAWSTR